MATYYLEVDDEITSAAARIRGSQDPHVALVLPAGSRVSTSRMNFRLLAREAVERNRRLAIVVPDAAVRALAGSAGLPVFATVAEYEAAEADSERARRGIVAPALTPAPDEGIAASGGPAGIATSAGASGTAAEVAAAQPVAAGPAEPIAAGRSDGNGRARGATTIPAAERGRGPAAESSGGSKRRRRRPGLAGIFFLALVVIALAALGATAYLVLPSATIAVTPRQEPLGPLSLTVRVDPNVTQVNAAQGVIPGQMRQFPEQAAQTFTATGRKVVETAATGVVTLTNCNNSGSVTFPAGTIVRTTSGISFKTAGDVTLSRATFTGGPGGSLQCTSGNTSVTATAKGLAGNVVAGAISRLPGSYDTTLYFVTNNSKTSGGTHTETTIVQQSDVDKAKTALSTQLTSLFAADLAKPPSLPAGLTLFPETGKLGAPTFNPPDTQLVNSAVQSFDLVATATGTALAADVSQSRTAGEARIRAAVTNGFVLDENSLSVRTGTPAWDGTNLTVPVTASATQTRQLDASALREAVKGRSAADAQTYLAQFGSVRLDLWPGWVTTVPTLDFRVDLTVNQSPAAASSPSPSETSSPSAVPSGQASLSPSQSQPPAFPVASPTDGAGASSTPGGSGSSVPPSSSAPASP